MEDEWTEDAGRRTVIFHPKLDGWGFEEGAQFSVDGDGIIVSVSEEQAVDSYNQSFECNMTMTRRQAEKLRDWLVAQFPAQ